MSLRGLLASRRFGPMFVCMALGAFNDNFYKNALIILITYLLAGNLHVGAALLINIAAACFILPFFLFSGMAGLIADRYAKHTLVIVYKVTELILCVLAGVALAVQHLPLLLLILFLFGTQSAFFGPVKYAILPELLKRGELLAGNGLIEAGTFLCILIGTLTGGLLILETHGVLYVTAILIALGAAGVYAAFRVPHTKATDPALTLRYNVVSTTTAMLRYAVSVPTLWFAILGISWFWAIGAMYLTQIPVFTKDVIGGDEGVASFYLGLFSVGIGIGAVSCQRILKDKPDARIAPLALLGICLFGLHLIWLASSIPTPTGLFAFDMYFDSIPRLFIALDLLALAACGGIFVVPLYTQLQVKSKPAQRARAIASNNVMNALFSTVAAILAAAFYGLDFTVSEVLLAFTAANIPVIYYLYRHVDWAK